MKLLAFLLCFSPFCLLAQQLPNVIPPSPQTQELNKYIDFPVDLSTGVPEISIPLYTIRTKGVDIPITLSYHASGIKSGQDDGDVGIGWSLSSNYRISRSIYGHVDTENITMSPSAYQTISNFSSRLDLDQYLSRFISEYQGSASPDTHMPPRSGGLLDGEYDQFNYIAPGQGGKFIISNRTAKTVSEFSPTTNKFSYIEGSSANTAVSGIIGFSMKDARQNSYSFGEQIDKLGVKVLETHNGSFNVKDVTAWALTDIDTKYDEKIKFSYTDRIQSTKYALQASLLVTPARDQSDDTWKVIYGDELASRNYSVFSLASITTQNEQVDFVPTVSNPKMVKQINIKDSETSILKKRIEFYYSQNYFHPSSYTFLDSIKIFDKDLSTYQRYIFDYYQKDLLSSSILVPDQWGYNKIAEDRGRLLHQEFGSDPGSYHGAPDLPYPGTLSATGKFLAVASDRKLNNDPSFFSLKRISYPTGGITYFEYEPNKVSNNYSGGIRIKTIKKSLNLVQHNSNKFELYKYYTYGDNDSGNGYSNYYLDEDDFRHEHIYFGATEDDLYQSPGENSPTANINLNPRKTTLYSSQSFSDATQITYYQYVTEMNGFNNGKVKYFFSAIPPIPVNAYPIAISSNNSLHLLHHESGPKYISEYTEWHKPNLLKKEYFDASNKLVKKEKYGYTSLIGEHFTGLKVKAFARFFDDYSETQYAWTNVVLSSFYKHGLYLITTGKDLLTSKSEITYSGNDSLKVATTFTYNNLEQVIKETTITSKNEVVEKSTVYPADIPYDYLANRLLQANDVNKVLEETIKVDNETVSKITNQYNELPGELFVADKIKRYNTATQLQEDGIVFHKYDVKGNILSLSKADGAVISYLWSYGYQYPIAEIKNADYSAIVSLLGGQSAVDVFSAGWPTDQAINNFLQPLRENSVMKDAFVTTYTYKPLVGMTSMTDAKGMTTFYDYDGFGRLSAIKDHNKDITKTFGYQYANSGGTVPPNPNTSANWQATGITNCEYIQDVNYNNESSATGNTQIEQIDANPLSTTYNQKRTIIDSTNPALCPPNFYFKADPDSYFGAVSIYAKKSYDDGASNTMRVRITYDTFWNTIEQMVVDIPLTDDNGTTGYLYEILNAVTMIEVELIEVL